MNKTLSLFSLAIITSLSGCTEEETSSKSNESITTENSPEITQPPQVTPPAEIEYLYDTYPLNTVHQQSLTLNLLDNYSTSMELSIASSTPLGDSPNYDFTRLSFEKVADTVYFNNPTPESIEQLYVEENGKSRIIQFTSAIPPYSKVELGQKIDIDGISIQYPLNLHLPEYFYDQTDCSGSDTNSVCYGAATPEIRGIYETHLVNLRNSLNRKSFWQFAHTTTQELNYSEYANHNEAWDYTAHHLLRLSARKHRFGMRVMWNQYQAEGVATWSGFPNMVSGEGSNAWGKISLYYGYLEQGDPSYRPFDGRTAKTFFHETAHCYGYSHSSGFTYGLADQYGLDYYINNIPLGERESIGVKKIPPMVFANKKFVDNKVSLTIFNHPDYAGDDARLDIYNYDGFSGSVTFDQENSVISLSYDERPTATTYLMIYSQQSDYMTTVRILSSDWP